MTHSIMFAKYKKIMMALTLFASAASVNADFDDNHWGHMPVPALLYHKK